MPDRRMPAITVKWKEMSPVQDDTSCLRLRQANPIILRIMVTFSASTPYPLRESRH